MNKKIWFAVFLCVASVCVVADEYTEEILKIFPNGDLLVYKTRVTGSPPIVPTTDLAPESDTDPKGDGRTTLSSVSLLGMTDANVSVSLSSGMSTRSDTEGFFRFDDVDLVEGQNDFVVTATNNHGSTTYALMIFRIPDEPPPDDGILVVTPTHLVTPMDRFPRFARPWPTHTAVQSGAWSDPATWGGAVPNDGAKVVIPSTVSVSYNVVSDVKIDAIELQGAMDFSSDTDTRLCVTDFYTLPGSSLTIGAASDPVTATCEIVFRDRQLKTGTVEAPGSDPAQYGNGLLVFGRLRVFGTSKSAFHRLAAEPKASDTSLTLEAPPLGWRSGDLLILPDSRGRKELAEGSRRPAKRHHEELVIASVSGTTVTLTQPLQYDHPAGRNPDGEIEFLPHVANLTRNVIFRSENPDGVRGHTLFGTRADVDCRYAAFLGLGRTRIDPLDSTQFDENWAPLNIGTNQIARYPIHTHHLWGPVRDPSFAGRQYYLIGNVVEGDDVAKWGIAIHGSHYGLIRDNVAYDCPGSGIVTEDGSESANVFDHNFACLSTGSGEQPNSRDGGRKDNGHEGSGLWFRGTNNHFTNNVGAQGHFAGFTIFAFRAPRSRAPLFPGANLREEGQYKEVISNRIQPLSCVGNEAYGSDKRGIDIWASGEADAGQGFRVEDSMSWHHGTDAVHVRGSIWLKNSVLLGDVVSGNEDFTKTTTKGFGGNFGYTRRADIVSTRIEGFHRGSEMGTRGSTWSDCYLRNVVNVGFPMISKATMRSTMLEAMPGLTLQNLDWDWNLAQTRTSEVFWDDGLVIFDHNKQGANFLVHQPLKLADSTAPYSNDVGRYLIPSMAQSLTNQKTWDRYGTCVGGWPVMAQDVTDVPGFADHIEVPFAGDTPPTFPPSAHRHRAAVIEWPANGATVNGPSVKIAIQAPNWGPEIGLRHKVKWQVLVDGQMIDEVTALQAGGLRSPAWHVELAPGTHIVTVKLVGYSESYGVVEEVSSTFTVAHPGGPRFDILAPATGQHYRTTVQFSTLGIVYRADGDLSGVLEARFSLAGEEFASPKEVVLSEVGYKPVGPATLSGWLVDLSGAEIAGTRQTVDFETYR